jgi:hypothetical protein
LRGGGTLDEFAAVLGVTDVCGTVALLRAHIDDAERTSAALHVRKMPSWPRSWANFSLL